MTRAMRAVTAVWLVIAAGSLVFIAYLYFTGQARLWEIMLTGLFTVPMSAAVFLYWWGTV